MEQKNNWIRITWDDSYGLFSELDPEFVDPVENITFKGSVCFPIDLIQSILHYRLTYLHEDWFKANLLESLNNDFFLVLEDSDPMFGVIERKVTPNDKVNVEFVDKITEADDFGSVLKTDFFRGIVRCLQGQGLDLEHIAADYTKNISIITEAYENSLKQYNTQKDDPLVADRPSQYKSN